MSSTPPALPAPSIPPPCPTHPRSYPECRLSPEEAALALERWHFLVQGPAQPQFLKALAENAGWEPPMG